MSKSRMQLLEELFASDEYQAMLEDYRRSEEREAQEFWENVWKPLFEKWEQQDV